MADEMTANPFVPGMNESELLDEVSKDFKRLQRQKSREKGGVEARVLTSRAFKWGEQYVTQQKRGLVAEVREDNKLHLVFNVIDKICQKLEGRLTSIGGQFYARPDKKDPAAQSLAEVADKLILALDEKLEQPTRMWELVDTLLTDGVAFVHTPWVPDSTLEPMPQFDENGELLFTFNQTNEVVTESQMNELLSTQGLAPEMFTIFEEVVPTGDVGCEVFGALNVFVDQGVKSLSHLAPDQAVYIAQIKTQGWVEENYPETGLDVPYDGELKIVCTPFIQEGDATASMFLKDLIPQYQGEVGEDDPKMAVVVHRYLPVSKKHPSGRYTCFIPDKRVLFDGDNPYGEIPLVDFHFGPVNSTFWTKDFITDLIAPQKFLNKRLSQMGEQANASIADKILLGGTLKTTDITPDKPQAIEKALAENGQPLLQRVPAPQLPTWFLEGTKLSSSLLMQIGGGQDLMEENQFPGQLRGPMAVPLLQELLDSAWGPLYMHIGQQMAKVHQQRLNRCAQFYEPIRTLHYTDKNQRDEVMVFHTDKVLRSGTNFKITVERGSLLPEFRALREARVRERLQSPLGVLYTDARTGQIDKSKVAADLGFDDYGREGKEAQSRKFAQQLIEKLWKGEQVPPVMQFWDHEPMLDELEGEMMTTEWLSASPIVQQLFMDRWNQHSFFLQQRAQMQQSAMMNQAIQTSVAQATQQAAAMAAADTVNSTQQQMGAQKQAEEANPIEQMIRSRQNQGQPQQ